MSKGNILFQISGSIAAFKSCAAISRLVQDGFAVEVVVSENALHFIGEATLEGLTGRAVHKSTFESGQAMQHIHLTKWADLTVLCPASANTINKLAHGIGDDLLTTLFLAHDFSKPLLIAPAMNTLMYQHPATQASLSKLREWGVKVLETGRGNLACGDVGKGRLLEPEEIVTQIKTYFSKPAQVLETPHTHGRVLISAGGTREPIDGVRAITNFSTGRTAATIADEFLKSGYSVTYVTAREAQLPSQQSSNLEIEYFTTAGSLMDLMRSRLSTTLYAAVLHLAAVSDFTVDRIESAGRAAPVGEGKIQSDGDLTLKLKSTPKIIGRLRDYTISRETQIFAFKLTNTLDTRERLAAIEKLASSANADFIVHNDLHEITAKEHRASIYIASTEFQPATVGVAKSKLELARQLVALVTSAHAEAEIGNPGKPQEASL
jgi:phosphopantothenoylcysteine decarboxylase/phosphopantothenate--cysteine ligase